MTDDLVTINWLLKLGKYTATKDHPFCEYEVEILISFDERWASRRRNRCRLK
jgi:hypothetical protein